MKKAGIKKKWFMGLLALGLLLTFMASGSANGLDIAVFCKWDEEDPNGTSVLLYIESIQEGEGGFFEEIVGTAEAVFRESTASCMEDGDDIYDVVNPSFNSDWQDLTFSGGTLTKTALRTGHSLTHMPYQAPATCVDWGHVECYFCSQCEGSFSEDDKWSNEPIENPDIDPLDPDDVTRHLWGDQPEWNWNYDHTSVEVTFSCNRDPENEHTYTMTVTNISDDGTTADCTGPKEKTYTAITELCGKQYTGTDAVAVEPVDHEYEGFLETVTPTCQAGGYDVYQCKWCTETTHKNETQAVDHDYTELVETVVPTCQAGGYDVYQCKWCTETTHKNETQAVDHDYTELLETIAATTCQEGGYDVYQCKWCTETTHKNETVPLAHDYTEFLETVAATTCQAGGYDVYQCKWCTETTHKSPTAPLAHVYDVFMETAAPTCQAGGYDIYKCKWCNATTHKNETAAVDHDYTELVETVAPTCQAGGYDIYRCEWCEETTLKNDTAPLDHDYTELVETVAPTCQASGYDIYRCEWCEETTQKNETAAVDHDYTEPKGTVAATCLAGGYDLYKCKWCEATTQKNETAAVDHDFSEWTESVTATCLAAGYDVYKCKWCEATTQKNETDPLGHQYGVPEWEWTGYTEAVAVFTCTRESCPKDAQGHKEEATATVTESGTEVTEDGTTVKVYTAKATFGGKDYTDQAKEPVQPIVPEPEKVKWTVTFIVYGGAWNDGTEGNIAVTLEGVEGETLKLAAKDIPAAGIVPFYGYTTGSWDEMLFDGMIITKDRTFTYTYEKKAANENLGNDQPGKDAEKPADDDDTDKIKFLREDIDDLLKLNQTTTKVNTLSLPASIAEHTISIGSPQVLQKDDVLPNAIRDAQAMIDELSKSLSVRETLDKSNPPDAIRDAQSMINRILGSANVELSNNNGGSPTTKLRMALDEEGNLPELSVSANQSSEAEAKDPRLLVIRKLEEPGAKIVEGGERDSGAEGGNERDGMTAEDERAASTDRLIANIRETSETEQPAQGDADKQAASAGAGGSKDEDFAERDRQKAEEFEAHNSGKYDISGKKSFYVNEETGETSALITGKGDKISWLRESNDGTDAWYGFNSPTESKNALPDGSIVSVNWISKENNPEEYEKKQLEIKGKGAAKLVLDSEAAHDNTWLFELNAYQQSTDDNGNVTWKKTDKGDFKDGMEVYIELGDDWDINDINAIWLDNQEQLSTPKIVTEEINGVSKRFAVLTLNGEKATDTADETGNTTTVTTDETGTTTTVTTNGNGGTGTVVTDKNGTIQFITTEKNGTRADYSADSSGLTLEKIETNDDQVDIPDEMNGADGKTYSVTAIAQGALEGNQQVTQTTFGSAIKNLQNQAMQGCKNLKNLILSSGQSKQ